MAGLPQLEEIDEARPTTATTPVTVIARIRSIDQVSNGHVGRTARLGRRAMCPQLVVGVSFPWDIPSKYPPKPIPHVSTG
jgi:hypothetical protein